MGPLFGGVEFSSAIVSQLQLSEFERFQWLKKNTDWRKNFQAVEERSGAFVQNFWMVLKIGGKFTQFHAGFQTTVWLMRRAYSDSGYVDLSLLRLGHLKIIY